MANSDYPKSNIKVINPYTFVPITPETVSGKKREELPNAETYYMDQSQLHTGVLHCTLQVITPLAIPDTETCIEEPNGHKIYPFYNEQGSYVIPGSTLRGVIRSVYETVTDSCFSTVNLNGDTNFSRRTSQFNAFTPGILIEKNGEFQLYKATRYLLPVNDYDLPEDKDYATISRFQKDVTNDKAHVIKNKNGDVFKTGAWVRFDVLDVKPYKKGNREIWEGFVGELRPYRRESSKKDKGKLGMLYIGESFVKKHGDSIFVKSGKQPLKNISSECLEKAFHQLQDTLSIYNDSAINKNLKKDNDDSKNQHEWYPGFKDLDPKKGVPLWYSTKNGNIYFSYASIGRTMDHNTLNDLLGERNRCTNRKSLCEACLLFGMIGGSGNEEQGMGSRIRVTDAHVTGTPITKNDVTLKELGTPRNSYMPFYAKCDAESTKTAKNALDSYDDEGAGISGRKYYWNNTKAKTDPVYQLKIQNGETKPKRNATVELMMPGTHFSFDVYYDGIRKEQLKKLLWALTIGQNKLPDSLGKDEDLLCHKLGRGKPLGLGSVKIIVDGATERKFDGENYGLSYLAGSEIKIEELEGYSVDAVRKVASMNPFPEEFDAPIEYPNIVDRDNLGIPLNMQQKDNKLARHQWYSNNKDGFKRGTGQNLPSIMEEDQTLCQLRYLQYAGKKKRT